MGFFIVCNFSFDSSKFRLSFCSGIIILGSCNFTLEIFLSVFQFLQGLGSSPLGILSFLVLLILSSLLFLGLQVSHLGLSLLLLLVDLLVFLVDFLSEFFTTLIDGVDLRLD